MKNVISQREIQLLEELIPERVSDEWLHNQELCMEVCTGYEESDCCGAKIKHHDICSECGEHCGTQCDDCELKSKCPQLNEP